MHTDGINNREEFCYEEANTELVTQQETVKVLYWVNERIRTDKSRNKQMCVCVAIDVSEPEQFNLEASVILWDNNPSKKEQVPIDSLNYFPHESGTSVKSIQLKLNIWPPQGRHWNTGISLAGKLVIDKLYWTNNAVNGKVWEKNRK